MAEIELSSTQAKVLKALSVMTQPVRANGLEKLTGETRLTLGSSLKELEKIQLAQLTDKKNKFWQITEAGREIAAGIPMPTKIPEDSVPPAAPPQATIPVPSSVTHSIAPSIAIETPITVHTKEPIPIPTAPETPAQETIVPSQAAILREIGERLGVSSTPKKGEGATLDAIIYWVERAADMNNLTDVWNKLTETGVPPHIIKRWVTLYAQTIPGKQIPEELKDKLSTISEKDRVAATEKGEVAPKPKRFSIVADTIIGDPEGDYDFNQAYKIWAQAKGVPSDQVNPMASALETALQAGKVGPELAATLLTSITPLITKQPEKQDNTAFFQMMQSQQTASQQQMQLMQQMLTTALEGKHNAEIEGVKALVTQKPPESSEQMRLLTEQINNQNQQINSLRESLHQEQIITIKEQNKAMIEQMQNQMTRLEQQIAAAAQGKSVDSKIGLLDKAVDKGAGELTGLRQDIKGFASMMMAKGEQPPKPRSPQEKQRFAEGLTKGIEKAEEAKRQAQELWGTSQG